MKKTNKTKLRIGLIITAIGLCVILYPLGSILLNNLLSEQSMKNFLAEEQQRSQEELGSIRTQAIHYNENLDRSTDVVVDPFDMENYSTKDPLDYEDGDIFGYMSIPKIDEELPIYLGASRYHLNLGVAQVDGTSLPVGGRNTRSVIAGHRGWTTQRIFKNIDTLEKGDIITMWILGEPLEYEVYEQELIKPWEYEKLALVPAQDTLTLLTCHPFLVNTERLLVNAVRVNAPVDTESVPVNAEAITEITETAEVQTPVRSEETSQKALIEKYVLFGLVGLLLILLLRVMIRFIRTFKRT